MSTPVVPETEPNPTLATEPTPPAPRRGRWIWIAGAATAVLVSAGGWLVYDRTIKEDPGVAACNAMRDHADAVKAGAAAPMNQAEYTQARAQFEESRHGDLREHGTALIDLVRQIQKLGKNPGAGAAAYVGPLTTHTAGLQTACAAQGVNLDLNLGGTPRNGG
ncbi:hypothetical protein [Actinoplanes sp. NPDC049118]|uniref:hypothetical protein n=1 Tax=Actinoplanes sp. NPDC049118 TaxID=3155769 RepID=UPI0033D13E2B